MSLSTFNSNNLPKAFLTALLLFLLTTVGTALYLIKTNALPAPMFTTRFSFDEKMRFMRENKSYVDADLIAIGSSGGLNNLSSEVILNHLPAEKRYFNFSTWGLTTECIFSYWKFIDRIANPKEIILFINLLSFQTYEPEMTLALNEGDLINYLNGSSPFYYYFKYHRSGMTERIKNVGQRRKQNSNFDSIVFDQNGGVVLEVPEDKVSKVSWQEEVHSQLFGESGYIAFENVLKAIKEKGVNVVVVQGPMREPYPENDPEYEYLQKHWKRVTAITSQHNVPFLNMRKVFSSQQELFADALHLNRHGAKLFTKKLLKRMERENVFQSVPGALTQKSPRLDR